MKFYVVKMKKVQGSKIMKFEIKKYQRHFTQCT